MRELPQPIRDILRDYCHVEWYEVSELAEDIKNQNQKFSAAALKHQFEQLINSSNDISPTINKITGNEFETDDEARIWLEDIYRIIF